MALISCKDLAVGYDNAAVAENITFELNEGDYLVVIGENGSGKSTLIKTLCGLIKPVSGNVSYDDGLKKTCVGYLPQASEDQKDFPASVWEVVVSGCLSSCGLRPFYNKKEKALARENIEKMGLKGMEKRRFGELSGGQKQRVLLARALCATQKLLVLDEPVSGLDPKVTAETYEIVKRLNDEGVTVIMISHDLTSAVGYSDHVLVMDGTIRFCTTKEYLETFNLKEKYNG